MNGDIDLLAEKIGLTSYQANVLKSNRGAYKLSRVVKRGCALYAPRVLSSYKLIDFIMGAVFGRPVDLIGKNKMLVRRGRGIIFGARGCYSAPVGRYRYYADDNGNIIHSADFMRKEKHK